MDSAIPKNPKVLPKHACDANGNLRADLLEPAPLAFRESYKEGGDAGEMEGREVQDAAEGAVAGGDPRDASGEAGGDAGREREACGGVTGERQVCRAEQMGAWSGRGMSGWRGGMMSRKREEGGMEMASKRM